MATTKKSTPPAGTATHKPACGCFHCKAGRCDELTDKLGITQLQLRNANEEKETALYDLKNEREGFAANLDAQLQAITTERDGYAAELKVLTTEANAQRLAADTATTRVSQLLTDNTSLRSQLTQPASHHEEGRGARFSTIGWLVLVGVVNFLLGRWTR